MQGIYDSYPLNSWILLLSDKHVHGTYFLVQKYI
jgi:hypothetical protein